ncbi:hypothetical protein Trydic_g8341 [Trypoxylus dichotomus]
MKIELVKDEVVTQRPYRLSYSESVRVQKQIDELKTAGIIEESASEFARPIVIVKRKTGEDRICIHYRSLNKITKKEKYPLPLIDDQLDRLSGKNSFTCLDMKSAYHQISVSRDSREKTAFVTPDGDYQFIRMPFGLVNGAAVFQRLIN